MLRLCLGLGTLLMICVSSDKTHAGIELGPDELKRLVKGELVARPLPESGKNSTVAGISFALVDASPEKVMRAINNVDAWTVIFPNTYESKIVGSRDGIRAVRMTLGNSLIKMSFYLTVVTDKKKQMVRFQLNKDKPHDIQDTRGWIRLIPQMEGRRTLVAFTGLATVPFGPIIGLLGGEVTTWVERRLLSVPARLKKWVEDARQKKVVEAPVATSTF